MMLRQANLYGMTESGVLYGVVCSCAGGDDLPKSSSGTCSRSMGLRGRHRQPQLGTERSVVTASAVQQVQIGWNGGPGPPSCSGGGLGAYIRWCETGTQFGFDTTYLDMYDLNHRNATSIYGPKSPPSYKTLWTKATLRGVGLTVTPAILVSLKELLTFASSTMPPNRALTQPSGYRASPYQPPRRSPTSSSRKPG
jgi:hypothetical protein